MEHFTRWENRDRTIGRNALTGGSSGGMMLVPTGIALSRRRCRNWSGRLSSRTQQPKGSSTGARSWPLSGQEIRWRQCRGCA